MTPRRTGKRTPSLIARRLLTFAFLLQVAALLAVGLPTIRLIVAELTPLLAAAPPVSCRTGSATACSMSAWCC